MNGLKKGAKKTKHLSEIRVINSVNYYREEMWYRGNTSLFLYVRDNKTILQIERVAEGKGIILQVQKRTV